MKFTNVLEAFWDQVRVSGSHAALVKKTGDRWEPIAWREFGERVARLSNELAGIGLETGDRVAIFSDNCPEWLIADYATIAAQMVSVPLYPNQTEAQIEYILKHSGAKAVFVRGDERLKKVLKTAWRGKIILIDGQAAAGDDIVSYGELIARGAATKPAVVARSEQLATISYTSGTTAFPKGVMLTHGNLMAEIKMLNQRSVRDRDDVVLSYLPLSHMAERMNQLRQSVTGYSIYFGQGLETLGRDIKEVRPTSFGGVPRVYEKFQEAVLAKLAMAPEEKKKFFARALEVGRKAMKNKIEGRFAPVTALRHRILSRKVGGPVRELLGLDRCKNFVGGAAPMGLETMAFFYALGMPIIEVYGLTECTGATHYNLLENPSFGTVGPHLEGMECKIADDGEILLKGGNVFSGYYNDEAATSEAFRGGWFCTGDIGTVDKNGCLKITDRKKSLIVTAAGKNIAPAPLEFMIKKLPFVSQVVVIGDKRKYLSALITLAPGRAATAETHRAIQTHIDAINKTLASYETIKAFTILERELSIEGGEMTPTLKIKRNVVQEKYKSIIDGMYETSSPGNLNPRTDATL